MAVCPVTAARWKKPPAVRIQSKKEEPKPQIRPAPGLVARLAKNNPKISPKLAPKSPPERSELFSTALSRKPPETPRATPRRSSIVRERGRAKSNCLPKAVCDSDTDWQLLHSNRLNDVSRKKEVHHPCHKHSNFAFQTWQFCKVDSPPEEPRKQTRKAQRLTSSKGNAQFGTGRLVAHNAESPE